MSKRSQRRTDASANGGRAFRGLFLVFCLSFLNLAGILLTITALGGLGDWSGWRFAGLYGVIEAGAGLSNIWAPNVWHLPVAELKTPARTAVRLAASALRLAHWGGAARAFAGIVLIVAAATQTGVAPGIVLLPVVVVLEAVIVLCISAVAARLGVAHPELDVVQIVIRWAGEEREIAPVSISASVVQFLLSVITIPAKLLPVSVLYRPEMAPSPAVLGVLTVVAATGVLTVILAWWRRIDWQAPREQQSEMERNA